MNNSSYFYVPKAYNRPNEKDIPVEEMHLDTERPEINSQQFSYEAGKNYTKPSTYLPFYCNIEYSDGLFFLASNNFTTFVFDGIIVGTTDFDSIAKQRIEDSLFKIPEASSICGLKVLEGRLFLAATMDSKIQLWDPTIRSENNQILKCDEKSTDEFVMHMDKLTKAEKFVIGSSNGSISVYDYDLKDLMSLTHYPHAHSKEITGISADPGRRKLWTSCSIDKSCALWDTSKERPALALLRDHDYRLTAVHWASDEENKGLVMIGDEIGNLLTVDPRVPKKVLNKTRIARREITKICFGGAKQFAAVSKSNQLPIVHVEECNELSITYTHKCTKMIYDMSWGGSGGKSFYVVGEQNYAEQVMLM